MTELLTDILFNRATQSASGANLTFLSNAGDVQNVSALQLHGDAGQIALQLRAEGVKTGELVPLVFEHGYDLVATFWGCMYAGAIPTIVPFIGPEAFGGAMPAPIKRLVQFAQASTIIAPETYASYLRESMDDPPVRIVAVAGVTADSPKSTQGRLPNSTHDGPPYVQFSSGTTGRPKGVCLTDAGLVHYLRTATASLRITQSDVIVGWLPLYHDMGLVNQVLQPIYGEYGSVFINPADWLREPQRLFRAITQYRGSLNWMPNFGFRYCLRRIPDSQLEGVDLSSWRRAGNGSEPALPDDINEFVERFGEYGLPANAVCIGYGMAEHVAGLTWTPVDLAPAIDWVSESSLAEGKAVPTAPKTPGSRAIVSCGPPLESVQIRIISQNGGVLPERSVGEMIVQSPYLFTGYYMQPDESAVALRDGWFHSGDLAYIADGELYICGRKKDLIIVAGRNIHPLQVEEIAETVMGAKGRFAASFGITSTALGTEVVVVVCEMRQVPAESEQTRLQQQIRDEVRRALAVFVAEVRFVGPGWIVRTTSGKINRSATRDKYQAETVSG